MLQAIVHWSLHNRAAVVLLAALLLLLGVYAAGHAKLDVFPDFAPPQVVIQTEAPGLSPADVERLVTKQIEDQINGIPRLDTLRSQSVQGLSVITAIFQDSTDIYRARQQVSERLGELAGQFPLGVKVPRMAPLTPASGRLVTVGFTSARVSPMQLRDRIQWDVRPRILAVRGVAQVTLFGGEVRQLQVQVHPDQLAARHLTLSDVLDAARQATGIRGAGYVENRQQRITLRTEGQVRTAAELGETVITTSEGTPVRLKDVATVREAPEPKFGDAAIYVAADGGATPRDAEKGVLLIVHKQFDSDTIEVTHRVEEELQKLEPTLAREGIVSHTALFRQANFIEDALRNVTESLLIGAVLVTIVLFLFLFNLRTAFISMTAIPLSLLSAVAVLWACGVSLNTLTLGGLAIAVGEVVDDAIIDVENIFRRLRENARLGQPRSALAVVLSASLEVRSAVVYATFIVVLVFVPVFFMTGLQGHLFAPLGYAYVLAILASLGVALTVTPALGLLLLPRAGGAEEPPLLRRLQGGYDWLLRRINCEAPLVLAFTALLVIAAGWVLSGLGSEFLPELRENHFVVHMRGLPGTALPSSLEAGNRVSLLLQTDPALGPVVRSTAQQVGRAELGEDTWGVEYSEIEVDLRQLRASDTARMERQLDRAVKENVPGFSFEVMPFLTERIKETLSGTTGTLAVKISGNDLEALDQTAQAIARALGDIKGSDSQPAASNVHAEPQTGSPELVVRVRQEDASRFGLNRVQILDAVRTAFQGAEVNQVFEGNRIIDVIVALAPQGRNDPDLVANLWLSTAGSSTSEGDGPAESVPVGPVGRNVSTSRAPGRIQLKQVADVFLSDGRFLIAHEGGMRRQVVTCNVNKNIDVESFVREAERRVGHLALRPGVSYVFAGEHEARRAAQHELLLLSLAVGAGILLLLWMLFRSLVLLALAVLVNLPFALVGGVAAIYLSGGLLDVGALVGFVTLFGITTRNGIMMVSHWQHLHEAEGVPWGPELVFRGARERLAPVLMTALVTALGLLPIALGGGEAGREIEGPMALVILGGLATSTVLNLFVLPLLYRLVLPLVNRRPPELVVT